MRLNWSHFDPSNRRRDVTPRFFSKYLLFLIIFPHAGKEKSPGLAAMASLDSGIRWGSVRGLAILEPLQHLNSTERWDDWKGRGADSEEKHEPASDIDTVVVDSLKALDPNGRLEKRTAKSYCSQYMMNSLKVSTQDLRHAQRLLRNLRQTLRHRQRKEGLSKQRLQRR